MADIAFLTGAIVGTFLLSRIFWLIAWKWPNSVTKAIVLNVVSALVIIPADYLAAIHAGNPASLVNGAFLYGGCQFLVFLLDVLRVRQQTRPAPAQRFTLGQAHEPSRPTDRKRSWLVWNPTDAAQAQAATKSGAVAGFVFAGMYMLSAVLVYLTGQDAAVGPVDNPLFILVVYVLPSVLAAGLAYWLLRRPGVVIPILLLIWFLVEVGFRLAHQTTTSTQVAWLGFYLVIAAAFLSAARGAMFLRRASNLQG